MRRGAGLRVRLDARVDADADDASADGALRRLHHASRRLRDGSYPRVDSNLDSRGLVSRGPALTGFVQARLEVHERLQRHDDERSGKRGSEKIRIFLIRAAHVHSHRRGGPQTRGGGETEHLILPRASRTFPYRPRA